MTTTRAGCLDRRLAETSRASRRWAWRALFTVFAVQPADGALLGHRRHRRLRRLPALARRRPGLGQRRRLASHAGHRRLRRQLSGLPRRPHATHRRAEHTITSQSRPEAALAAGRDRQAPGGEAHELRGLQDQLGSGSMPCQAGTLTCRWPLVPLRITFRTEMSLPVVVLCRTWSGLAIT